MPTMPTWGRDENVVDYAARNALRLGMASKPSTSFRLSPLALKLLALLAVELGLSQASTLEVAIRELAKRKGVSAK